jgi:cytochrome c biogenesis protein CcmG/thiol:disulfide interchange protein DsbE
MAFKMSSNRFNSGCVTGRLLVLALLCLSFAACTSNSKESRSESGGVKNLPTLPGFELKGPSGKLEKSSGWKEPYVVIHFWAAWCAPCIEELPAFVRFVERSKGLTQVRFVAINLDPQLADATAVLPLDQIPSNLTYLLDPDKTVPEKLGSFQFPETYLAGSSRQVLKKWVGAQDWSQIDLNNLLQSLNNK